uniref:Uncharacterized protein n=1 Tax=Phaseolus vulgaris TaxID=3885 RepID=V7CMP3_PHAVU|nr:hypothetical protein PHAVU_002G241200g [Phaseolus vulgaris]ESW31477.1 hypothetical protein PHAVU_002G241200g [Phaseolus vulgaris]
MRTAAKIAGMGFSRMGLWGLYFSLDSSYYSSPGCEVSALSPTLCDEPVNRSRAVVASLACYPNVWNAAMENPAVCSFFQYHNRQALSLFLMFRAEETAEEVVKLSSCASEAVETPEKASSYRLQNLELTGIELVSRVRKSGAEADGNTKTSFMDSKFAQGGILVNNGDSD